MTKTNHPVIYDSYGRMIYHPDYHPNHGKSWMLADERYLIENYGGIGTEEMSLSLGRTVQSVMQRALELRRSGKMPPVKFGRKTHKRIRRGGADSAIC